MYVREEPESEREREREREREGEGARGVISRQRLHEFSHFTSSHYPAPSPSPHCTFTFYNWSTLWLKGCDLLV